MEGTELSPAPQARKQLKALTGIRAFAAFWVLLFHTRYFWYPVAITGQQAVTLFFVLSGFLMSYCYHHCTFTRLTCFVDFWFRRIARIVPSHTVMLLIILIPFPTFDYMPSTTNVIMMSFFFMNTYMQCDYAMDLSIMISWSVSAEMFFYICFPFLFLGLRWLLDKEDNHHHPIVRRIFFYLTWVLIPIIINGTLFGSIYYYYVVNTVGRAYPWCWHYYLPAYRLLGFMAGMWAGMLTVKHLLPLEARVPANRKWIIGVVVDVLIIVVMVLTFTWLHPHYGKLARGASAYLAVLILIGLAMEQGIIYRILALRPIVYLGEISFQFYLYHAFIIIIARNVSPKPLIAHFFVIVGLSLLCSIVAHHVVENPCYKFLMYLKKRYTPQLECDCKKRHKAQRELHQSLLSQDGVLSIDVEPQPHDRYTEINSHPIPN